MGDIFDDGLHPIPVLFFSDCKAVVVKEMLFATIIDARSLHGDKQSDEYTIGFNKIV